MSESILSSRFLRGTYHEKTSARVPDNKYGVIKSSRSTFRLLTAFSQLCLLTTMSYGHSQYQYAAVPISQQQNFYNGSTFTQKSDGPPSTLVAAQEGASRKWVVRNTCLIATGILISLVGMLFAFLSFICIFHQCQVSKVSVVSTAPLGRVLTISQVTSHVAPLSVPIIMGLFSYLLSARWLKSSVDGGPNRPSPMQYVWILDFLFPF